MIRKEVNWKRHKGRCRALFCRGTIYNSLTFTSKLMYHCIEMEIRDYATIGGKNLIMEYIHALPDAEKTEILEVRQLIAERGTEAFAFLTTRQLYKKLWEIKISKERIMYIIRDADTVYFLNICKKQKGKTEKQELEKAKRRAKEEGLL